MSKITKNITEAIKAVMKQTTSGYDTSAVVKRIEGGTAWVHIPGGVDETPVKLTIDAHTGDTVQVRVSGGSAWLVGNASAPPTDNRMAFVAKQAADDAANAALNAKQDALDAQQMADQNAIDMANAVVTINADIADLQSQIDGNITSWFYEVDPAMNLPPVTLDPDNPGTGWDTDEKKQNHVGDLYYNTDTGHVWRFVFQNATYQWVAVEDSDVTRALEEAARAQDTADHKRRVFITTPVPPYDQGDLWCEGNSGDILTCTTAKVEGQSYSSSDWSKLNKYTDDSRANAAYNLASTANGTANNALTSANGKNRIYHQSSKPTGGTYIVGDTWFDTDDGYKMYTYNGNDWAAEQFGNAAIANLSITNAKIANGTIESAKISALDAGKITTGTLDAARIAAGSLSISQVNSLQTTLNGKVTTGANVSVLTNDGTYATGKMRSITLSSAKSYTYAAAASYVGLSSDSWSGVSSIGGGTWNKGDMVAIPCTISDRNNAAAFFLCRIVSYSGTTLVADNLALELDSDASKYVTEISGYDGVTVHDAGDTSNFTNTNSNGFYIYKSGALNASFEANQATMGSGKAILKYSEDGSAFGLNNSHRVVLAKATDEGSGVRNDATLSSREIGTWDNSKPMAFVNTTHMVNGATKTAQAGLYAWHGDGTVSPIYVVLQAGNGTGSSPLTGDAVKGLYVSVPKLVINGADWTSVKTNLDSAVADISDLSTEIGNVASQLDTSTGLVPVTHTVLSSETFAQYNFKSSTKTFTKSGYYPIGIVGHDNGSGDINASTLQLTSRSSGSATLTYAYKHIGANTSRTVTTTVTILWLKII